MMTVFGRHAALCLKFIVLLALLPTTSSTSLCPVRCRCFGDYPSTDLTVDCHRSVKINLEQLTEQLDAILSINLKYGRLRSLKIVNTPLTNVPPSVCRLTMLTQLSLDHNRLTRLPDNCFSNFTALTLLTASNNQITELQDGVFDGLYKLRRLRLNNNSIVSIGLQVFYCPSKLTSLTEVNLAWNSIQTLEPWPIYLGMNGGLNSKVLITLARNNISSFSNRMGCKPQCGINVVYVDLRFDFNPIRHISDLLHGWGLNITTFECLFPRTMKRVSTYISFYQIYLDCDCVDFDIYKLLLSEIYHSYALMRSYCNSPPVLFAKGIPTVHLDQFVCELTERCPHGCRCVHRPFNATLHVYCANANVSVLPHELPALPKSYTTYKLEFANNRQLRQLEHRDYFANTSILDVSNCNLDSIDVDMWNELANISRVFLDGNRLQSLPSSVVIVKLNRTKINLGGNPWKCSCEANWMSSWLKSVRSSLIAPNAVTCSFPARFHNRNVMSISKEAFCKDPTSEAVKTAVVVTSSSAVGAFLAILSVGFTIHRLRVKLYTRWKFHPFDRDECLGEDMDYDVFLSCCSNENLPHGNEIRVQVEQRGYRVCYPPRDFIAGEAIYDNIYNAVVRSKRTVCFLTTQFLQSGYCMHEFDVAFHHNILVKRRKRLIILMALESSTSLYANEASDTTALRQYLRQYTYIIYAADDWLDTLLYALPLHGMLQDAEVEERQHQDALMVDPFCEQNQPHLNKEGNYIGHTCADVAVRSEDMR